MRFCCGCAGSEGEAFGVGLGGGGFVGGGCGVV